MAFIRDSKTGRISDPVRGIELVGEGSGSDGTTRFKLVGPVEVVRPNGEWHFAADRVFGIDALSLDDKVRLTEEQRESHIQLWQIRTAPTDLNSLIKEAMLVLDPPPTIPGLKRITLVRFGRDGSVFDVE